MKIYEVADVLSVMSRDPLDLSSYLAAVLILSTRLLQRSTPNVYLLSARNDLHFGLIL